MKKIIIHTSLFIILFLAFFFVIPSSAQAADRYWVGGTGNWSDNTNHWASSSGGAPGASTPTTSDNCNFDANSFSGASQTVTIDTSANCLNMVWTGATNTPTLAFTSQTVTIDGSATFISGMNISNTGTPLIKLTGTSGTLTFAGASKTFYNLQFANPSGTPTFVISGSNTFNSLPSTALARTITFTAGTTQTITSRNGFITGSSGAVQTLQSSSAGSAWYVSSSTGDQQSSDYLSLQDSIAVQAKTWYAGANSTNVSGNTNWVFATPGYSVNSPKAYWKLDDATGTNAQDSTSFNNDGTLTSGPTWQTEDQCVSGKCLFFDGSNDYVEVTASNSLNASSAITLSAWVRPTSSTSSNQMILVYTNGVSEGVQLFLNPVTGAVGVNYKTTGGVSNNVSTSTGAISANKWSYLTTTYDGSTIKIYVNGVLQTSSSLASATLQTSYNLRMAKGTGNIYKGFIDESKVFNYARTASQIAADFNARSTIEGASFEADGALNNNPNALNNNLVGYWKMNESSWNGTAGEVVDSSGNSNNGTGNGGITTAAGKFGNGGSFDGTDDYISVADASNLRLSTGAHSSFAWVNTSSPSTIQSVIRKGSLTFVLALVSSGKVFCQVGNTSINTGTAVSANTWAHIGCTYDGITLTSYLNGVSQGSTTVSPAEDEGTSVFLGSFSGSSQFFVGKLDEVRLYNRTLTPNQVSQLYNFAPGPISYWNFEEGSGTTINDKSGFANAGTFNGSGTTKFKNGKYGFAGNFNGSDDDVSTTNVDLISNQGTISSWVYITAYPVTGENFIHQIANENTAGNDTDYKLQLGDGTDGGKDNVVIDHRLNGVDSFSTSTTNLSLNTWYYVSGTWDGSTVRLYINGVLEDSDSASGVLSTSETGAYKIGELAESASRNWQGQLDEIKIYGYARTQQQVVEDMNGGHPAPGGSLTAQSSNFGMSGTPVGYWKFNEGQGTTANNSGSAGLSINGALTNMASPATSTSGWTNSGKFGKGIVFDGSNDVVTVSDNAAVDVTTAVTISAWINPTSVSTNNHGILAKNEASGYYLDVLSGGTLNFAVAGTSSACFGGTITTNTWQHVAATYDGAFCKIYINGVLIQSTARTGAITPGSSSLFIGQRRSGGTVAFNEPFEGTLDEVKLYSFALTADQVKQDMNRGANEVLGAAGDNSSYQSQSANQEFCVPGDSTACTTPVGEWKFEEGSGTSANDTSGNANTGTLTNGPAYTSGKIGKAINFDGTNDYIEISSSSSLNTASAITLSAWVKPTSTTNASQMIFAYTNGVSEGVQLSLNPSTGTVSFNPVDTGGSSHSITASAGTISANQWSYLAATFDGTSAKLYVNGKLVASNTFSSFTLQTSYNLRLAKGTGNIYQGLIDQARVFNYARSAAQINWDYNRGAPVAMYKLDECTGSSLNDSSGNSNTATITIGSSGTQTSAGTCVAVDTATAWYNGRTGKFNSSLNFDGTDDSAITAAATILNPGTNFYTLSGWVKTTATTTKQPILVLNNGTNDSFDRMLISVGDGTTAGKPNCEISVGTGTFLTGTTSINDGNWHLVTCTRTGTGEQGTLYVDAIPVATSTTITGSSIDTDSKLRIAKDLSGNFFNGQIDGIRTYNYALTANQVKILYDQDAAVRYGPLTGSP